jgi:hypothetical protein
LKNIGVQSADMIEAEVVEGDVMMKTTKTPEFLPMRVRVESAS